MSTPQQNMNALLKHFEDRLADHTKTLGPFHPDTILTWASIGEINRMSGNHTKAIEVLEQLSAGFPEITEELKFPYSLAHNNLGMAYWSYRKYDKAAEILEKLLKWQLDTWGPEHEEVNGSRMNLGQVYKDRGDLEKALPLYETALQYELNNPNKKIDRTGDVYKHIGDIHKEKRNYKEAKACYEKAYPYIVERFGKNDPETISIKKDIDRY